MGPDATKPVFRASNKGRPKPISSATEATEATEASLKIKISLVACLDMILPIN